MGSVSVSPSPSLSLSINTGRPENQSRALESKMVDDRGNGKWASDRLSYGKCKKKKKKTVRKNPVTQTALQGYVNEKWECSRIKRPSGRWIVKWEKGQCFQTIQRDSWDGRLSYRIYKIGTEVRVLRRWSRPTEVSSNKPEALRVNQDHEARAGFILSGSLISESKIKTRVRDSDCKTHWPRQRDRVLRLETKQNALRSHFFDGLLLLGSIEPWRSLEIKEDDRMTIQRSWASSLMTQITVWIW